MNIEQQNKEPQNDEVITSLFEIHCSTFCGSKPAAQIPNLKVSGFGCQVSGNRNTKAET
jgi:hypothetical protein